MTRNPDPLHDLADALSEDIVATPVDALMHEAAGEPGGDRLVAAFDRVAARAAAQSRRRRLVERVRGLVPVWPGPLGWRSAMAGVAGLFLVVIAGGLYFHQQDAYRTFAPPRSPPSSIADRSAPIGDNGPTSLAQVRPADADRPVRTDRALALPAPPAAAPPIGVPAPPAAAAADEANRMRTVEARPDVAASEPPARAARKATPPQPPAEDRVAALAIAAEQQQSSAPSAASSTAPAAPAVSSYAASRLGPGGIGADLPEPTPGFVWPARGRVIAGFGSPVRGAPNRGVDLAVAAGTDLHAAQDGVVLYAGNEIMDLGNLLLLRHRDGFLTAYAHVQSFAVKPGDSVRRGQVIARSGRTGVVSKPQLHFEIRKDHAPVDPARYLPPPG